MKNNTALTILIVIIVGAAAFFGGMKYQQMQRIQGYRQQFGGVGNMMNYGGQQGRGRNGGARPVVGEILSKDDKSVTVKMPDGSTKIILLSATTSVSKTASGSASDLKVGERVGVFGTENTDGSVTAQNIQLNPMFRGVQSTVPVR